MDRIFVWVSLTFSIWNHLAVFSDEMTHLVEEYHLDVGNYLKSAEEKVQISSWTNPTVEDYLILQEYLSHAHRPELKYLNYPGSTYREDRIRNFKIVTQISKPVFNIVPLNGKPEEKTNCIITYISIDPRYEQHLGRLIASLKKVGFDGHLIYRIGGWPNAEEGSLYYFDVPYAFKLYAVLEAKRLGYKNCLWVDSCIIAYKKLDPIFQHIEKHGCYFITGEGPSDPGYIHEFATQALANKTLEEFCRGPVSSAIVFGFDLKSEFGLSILFEWKKMIENKLGCLSHIPEMAPLFYLAEKFHLLDCAPDLDEFSQAGQTNPKTILYWNHNW